VAELVGVMALFAALALVPLVLLAVLVGAPGRSLIRIPGFLRRRRRSEDLPMTHRPLSDVAADARRLAEGYHREGMRFAQYEGRRQAFDRVLGEAAEMLEIEHLLHVLPPGPSCDQERARVEARLTQAGLLLHRSEPA
jgi:ABC-type molybdate transport system ATPase subunit